MLEKGLVVRTEESRAHRYRARAHQDPMQRRLVRDLLDRAFSGSLSDMMQAALPAERATNAELEEIRRLLTRLEEAE
jgi:predicted transcriptional regulator